MTHECGDPYSGIGCPVPGCTHDPKGWPESASMSSCLKHPHWSGMSDDCLFCKRNTETTPPLGDRPTNPAAAVAESEGA